MAIMGYEEENRAYWMSGVNPIEDAAMVVNEMNRGDMSRSQPAIMRTHPTNLIDTPNSNISEPEDTPHDGFKLHHDNHAEWIGEVNVDGLKGGWSGLVTLQSNIGFNPTSSLCFPQSVLGNHRALHREHAGRNDQWRACLNTMPIQFSKISQRVQDHFERYLSGDEDMIYGLTILQVLGFDEKESMVYGRIYQPEGASDDTHTITNDSLSSKTLLAFHYALSDEINIGDILVVPCSTWNGTGFVLDAVRTTQGIPPCHIPNNDSLWKTWPHDSWRYKDSEELDLMKQQCYGEIDEVEGLIHYNKQEAHNFGIAMAILTEIGVAGEAAAGVELQQHFIPSWKDKRGVLFIDRASPFPAHYHDEIRCSVCNGRVLIKLKGDNKSEKADCPHCNRTKTLLFPHLVSGKTDTIKTVGDTQRDDTNE